MTNLESVPAERSVLGGLMLDNGTWEVLSGMLAESDFSNSKHRLIFQAIASLAEKGRPFDVVTMAETLDAQQFLERAGGLPYLGMIAKDTPSAANICAYAEIVQDYARRRRLREVFARAYEKTAVPDVDLDSLIGDVVSRTEAIIASGAGISLGFAEASKKALEYIDELADTRGKGGLVGVPTGISAIDDRTGGLQRKRLVVLAARPSIGKTTFASQIAIHAALKGLPVGIISLEMGTEELVLRTWAHVYGLNVSGLSFGDESELTRLMGAMKQRSISDMPIHIDTDTYSLGSIVARLTEWKHQHGIALGIVDHIGLIEGGDSKTRNDWLGTVSRTLKITAKRLDMPIIGVSQLNRSVEREKRKPVLADLRDSGNVEQDADICIFLHVEGDPPRQPSGIPMEIGLLKNRMGRRGWLQEKFVFDGRTQRIRELICAFEE